MYEIKFQVKNGDFAGAPDSEIEQEKQIKELASRANQICSHNSVSQFPDSLLSGKTEAKTPTA